MEVKSWLIVKGLSFSECLCVDYGTFYWWAVDVRKKVGQIAPVSSVPALYRKLMPTDDAQLITFSVKQVTWLPFQSLKNSTNKKEVCIQNKQHKYLKGANFMEVHSSP